MAPSITTDTTESYRARVNRGAAWLDERRPGWHTNIKASRINVDSSRDCVIAQAVGKDFGLALLELDAKHRMWSLASFGFAARGGDDTAALNREWAELVLRRQYGENPPPAARLRGVLRRLRDAILPR